MKVKLILVSLVLFFSINVFGQYGGVSTAIHLPPFKMYHFGIFSGAEIEKPVKIQGFPKFWSYTNNIINVHVQALESCLISCDYQGTLSSVIYRIPLSDTSFISCAKFIGTFDYVDGLGEHILTNVPATYMQYVYKHDGFEELGNGDVTVTLP